MESIAVSIGSPFPPLFFQAEVHSVFNHAVNLRYENSDNLIGIIVNEDYDQPGDIRLSSIDCKFLRSLIPGQHAICKNGRIMFERSPLVIRLDEAQRVDCGLPDFRLPEKSMMLHALAIIDDLLNKTRRSYMKAQKVNWCFQKKLDQHIHELYVAAIANDHDTSSLAVRDLIGLGSGLTPSGDDVLVGFLAGFAVNKGLSKARDVFYETLKQEVIVSSERTNFISRKYLILAVQGYYSTAIIHLLQVVCSCDTTLNVAEAASKVLGIGHTSGLDSLAGIAVSLKTILDSDHDCEPTGFNIRN